MPAAAEWLANVDNPNTRRAYELHGCQAGPGLSRAAGELVTIAACPRRSRWGAGPRSPPEVGDFLPGGRLWTLRDIPGPPETPLDAGPERVRESYGPQESPQIDDRRSPRGTG